MTSSMFSAATDDSGSSTSTAVGIDDNDRCTISDDCCTIFVLGGLIRLYIFMVARYMMEMIPKQYEMIMRTPIGEPIEIC